MRDDIGIEDESDSLQLFGADNSEDHVGVAFNSADLSSDSDYEPSFEFSDSDEDFDDDAYVERFEHARERNGGRASGGHKRRHRHNEFCYRF
nr:hypothetical protein Iba_chr04aCG22150 [Ipomoea batatas]GMD22792.1 hypothetical protein Iba_scaffold42183CG0010 [Ipomoea batatas]